MKLQAVVVSGLPAASRMAVAPPVSVTVYRILAASVTLGLRIHWLVVPLRETTAVTSAPVAAFFNLYVVVLTPVTASFKVVVTFAVRPTAMASIAGVRAETIGFGPVRKLQLVLASGLPAASRMAVAPVRAEYPSTSCDG